MTSGPAPEYSVVVPVFNEAGNAAPLAREIHAVLVRMGRPFEILFVNDGSSDGTLRELEGLFPNLPQLRVVDLDGNFGESAALSAGFRNARGRLVVTLDGDGQNDPADIPALVHALEAPRIRAATGWRRDRKEGYLPRVLPSRIANALIAAVTALPVHDNGCGLKAYRREVVEGASLPRGFHRFLPAVLGVGREEVREVGVRDRSRRHGQSHYGFDRTLVVARDLLALPFILWAPRASERAWAALTGSAAVAGLWGLWQGDALVGLGALLACAPAATIHWNLRRYNGAQRQEVFRVRAFLPGAPSGGEK